MKARPLVTFQTSGHLDCHCPTCRWAEAGLGLRLLQFLGSLGSVLLVLALCVVGAALGVFVLLWAGERLLHLFLEVSR